MLGVAPARLGAEIAVHEVRDALPRRPLPLDVRRPVDLAEAASWSATPATPRPSRAPWSRAAAAPGPCSPTSVCVRRARPTPDVLEDARAR